MISKLFALQMLMLAGLVTYAFTSTDEVRHPSSTEFQWKDPYRFMKL